MATDFRDYFNTRIAQEMERNTQQGISTKYQEVQQAAADKVLALELGIAQAKQRELVGESSILRRTLGDGAVALAEGVVGLGDAVVGAGDLLTGGLSGKGWDALGRDSKATHDFLEGLYSPEQRLANAQVADAKGFLGTLETMLDNPSTIGTGVVESLPSMLAGGGVGQELLAQYPKVAALAARMGVAVPSLGAGGAGAIGEGVMMAGSQAEAIRQETEDRTLSFKQAMLAAGTGVAGAAIARVGHVAANRLGVGDIDEAVVAGSLAKSPRGYITSVPLAAGLEAGEEMAQSAVETIAKNVALDKQWSEGVGEAAAKGLLTAAPLGAVAGLGSRAGNGRAEAAQERAGRAAKEAAQTAAITSGDVSALVDQKSAVYDPAQAVAALAGHSAQPTTAPEVQQANLQKAGEVVAELENVRDAVWAKTPEGIASRKQEVAQAQAAGNAELADALQATIPEAEPAGAEARSLKVQLARLDETLGQARENLTRFTTEAANRSTAAADSADLDSVINLSMVSPERVTVGQATSLANDTTNKLTPAQRSYLREFSAARIAENQAKSTDTVQGEIFHGGKGYVGLTEHRSRVTSALAANNEQQANRHLAVLRAFEKDHLAKADLAAQAWDGGAGKGTQIVKQDGKWAIHQGARLSDAAIQRNGGLTLNTEKLPVAITAEAGAITAALKELEAARALKFKSTTKTEGEGHVENVPQAHDAAQDAAGAKEAAQAPGSVEPPAAGPVVADAGGGARSSALEPAGLTPVARTSADQTASTTADQQSSQLTQSTTDGIQVPLQSTESPIKEAQAQTESSELSNPSQSPEETSEDQSQVSEAEGQLVAVAQAAPEGSLFNFGDRFKQVVAKAGDATKRPLVAVRDFLSTSFTGDKFREFLALDKDADFSEQQKQALSTFRQAAKAWFPKIQGNLARKSSPAFWYDDLVQFLVQEVDGKLDLEENVKTAIAYAAFSFVAENATRPEQNTPEEINAILNREENHPVSDEEQAALGRVGTRQNVVINALGQRVVDALGLSAKSDASLDLMPRLVEALGAQTWKLLLDEQILVRSTMTAEEMANLTGNPVEAGKEKVQYQFIKLARNEKRELNQAAQSIFEANRGSQAVLDKLFGVEPALKDPSLEPIPFNQQGIRNTRQGVPDALAKIIEHENKQPNHLRLDMWQIATLLDEDAMLEIAGAEHVDSTTMHKINRLATEAKNDGLKRELENFQDFVNFTLGKTKDALESAVYFPHVVWKQQRVGIGSNTVNPQTSKIHRHMLYRPTWKTTIDPSNDEQLQNFRLRVAEGLGIKTDKKGSEAALAEFDTKVEDPKIQAAIAALKKGLAGEGITKADQQAIVAGVKAGGENMHSLDALVALAQEVSDKPFEVMLMGEVDGVTNGPMLSHLLLGAAESSDELFDLLNRGGFYQVGSDVSNYNIWRGQPGNFDLYERTARNMVRAIQDLINTGVRTRKGKVVLQGSTVGLVANAIYSFTGQLAVGDVVQKAGRDIVKTPLTAMVFGSATGKAVDSMANKFIESIYAGIEASVTGGKLAQSREALIDNINLLLEVGGGPTLGPKMSFEELMEHEFKPAQVKALKAAFTKTVGTAVRETMETDFAPFIARRQQFNLAAQLAHGLYDAVYSALRSETAKELTAKGEIASRTSKKGELVPLFDLTKKQEAGIRSRLAKAAPVMHTFFSKKAGSLRGGLSISKSGRKLSQEDTYAQEIKFGTKTPDGKQSVNTHGYEQRETAPGVAMVPMSVHSSDSAISHLAAMLGEVLNVHDAHGSGVGGFQQTAQNLNQATWQVMLSYSPASEMFAALSRTVVGLAAVTKEGPLPDAAIANLNKLLVTMGEKLELEGSASVQQLMQDMKAAAYAADRMKLEVMSQLQSIDQYALEGGHYEVTEQDRAKAAAMMSELSETLTKEELDAVAELAALLEGKAEGNTTTEVVVEIEPAAKTSPFGVLGNPATVDAGLVEFFETHPAPTLKEVLLALRASIMVKGGTRTRSFQVELLNQLYKSIPRSVTVKLVTPETAPADVLAMPKQSSLGWFVETPDKSEIYILSDAFVNSGLQSTETLLHELTHAAVGNIVARRMGDSAKLVRELEALMKKANEYAAANGLDSKFADALGDVQEFIAYGMTSEVFQRELLSKISMETSTSGNKLVTGFKAFIDTVIGLLFRGSSKSQQAIMANGLTVMVQNVSGLLNQAEQERGQRASLNLSQAVQSFTTLDIHNALNGDGLSTQFTSKLSDLLGSIVHKLHGPFGAFRADILQRGLAAATPEAVWLKALDTGAAPMALSVRASPIATSDRELHAMEQVEATVRAALASNDVTARSAYKELNDLFTEMRAAIQPSAFASQDEHDFIFKVEQGADGRSHHLARFAAFALAHQGFNQLMQRDTAIDLRRVRDGKSFAERIQILFEKVLAFFAERATHTYAGQQADSKLEQLVGQLIDIEAKKRLAIAKAAAAGNPSLLATAEKVVTGASEKLKEAVVKAASSDLVRNSSNTFVKLGGSLARLHANDQVEFLLRELVAFRDKEFPGLHGLPTELLNQVKGMGQTLNMLQLMSTNSQRQRKRIITMTSKAANAAFQQKLDKTAKSALSQVFLRTGMHALLDRFSMMEIERLMADPTILAQEIAQTEAEFGDTAALSPYVNQFIHQANALGYFRVTGKVKHERLMMNAHNISRLYGTTHAGRLTAAQSAAAQPIIERLVALYALGYVNNAAKTKAQGILRMENDRPENEGNGVEFVLRLHRNLEQESADRIFRGQSALMMHGYTPEIYNPGTVVAVANAQQGEDLLAQGYTKAEAVRVDPADPDQEPRHLYVLKDGGLARFQTGIVSYSGKRAKGSTQHSGYLNVNTADGLENASLNADIGAAKPGGLSRGPRPDLSKSDETFMAPVVDPMGTIVNWRYLMADATKDSVLERDNRFDNVLGVLAGSIFDKESTKEVNSKALAALKEIYQGERHTQAAAFVLVGPNSPDAKLRDIWAMLPDETKMLARNVFSRDGMYVKKDMLTPMFGYRQYSLAEAFRKDPDARGHAEKVIVEGIEWILATHARLNAHRKGVAMSIDESRRMAKKAAVMIARFEKGWQEIVHEVKDIIVVKSIKVLVDNVMSNWSQLVISGVPIRDILRHNLVAMRAARAYETDSEALDQLQIKVDTGTAPANAAQEMARLKDAMARNPVRDLIEAGLMPTIVEDVAADDESDPYSYKSQLVKKAEALTSKLPPSLVSAAKFVYMSHDGKVYQGLSRITRLSDFVARYTLYQHLINQKQKDGTASLSKEEALHEASEAFVNYDSPLPKQLQYLDSMGIVPFTKYYLRIQRVLIKLIRKNPARVLATLLLNNFVSLGPIVLDSSWMHKLGNNPLQWGALQLPGTLDELGTIAAATALIK